MSEFSLTKNPLLSKNLLAIVLLGQIDGGFWIPEIVKVKAPEPESNLLNKIVIVYPLTLQAILTTLIRAVQFICLALYGATISFGKVI